MNNLNIKFRNVIYLFIISLSLVSCEDFFTTTLTIDPPKHEEKLVLIGNAFTGDEKIDILISNSIGILEDDKLLKPIKGAIVSATHNGENVSVIDALDSIGRPIYTLLLKRGMVESDKIFIKVSYADFPMLEVETTMPVTPKIDNIIFEREGGKDPDGSDVSTLSFDYENKAELSFFKIVRAEEYDICVDFNPITFECNMYDTVNYKFDITVKDPSAVKERFVKKISSVDGVKKRYTGQTYRNDLDHEYLIVTMNEDLYNYEISRSTYEESIDNPFATAVNVKSNIKNGFGFFGLYNIVKYKP